MSTVFGEEFVSNFGVSFIYLYIFLCVFFSRKKGSGSVISSMGKLVCCHLGSVAKGSFLITIFKLPRLVLTYIDRK